MNEESTTTATRQHSTQLPRHGVRACCHLGPGADGSRARGKRPDGQHARQVARAGGTPQARQTGGLGGRAGRPEHEPQVRDDGAVPAGDDQHHPRGLRPGRHLLRRGRGLRAARGGAHPRRRRGAVPRQGPDRDQVRMEHRLRRPASGVRDATASPTTSSVWSRAC